MKNIEIMAGLTAHLPLKPHHREALKLKRGFTDEVIDSLKIKSLGAHVDDSLPEFFSAPKDWKGMLQQDNILIPYLDEEGTVYHARPHKLGFPKEGHQIYVPFQYIGSDFSRIVIAESEFKAVASCLMGVPAIGIPGISSFAKKNFGKLMELLTKMKTKQVVICFDNEIKNDPHLPNFKPDYTKRYDAEFYSFIMAVLLGKSFHVSVAVLPIKYAVDGKIDIDGFLAGGHPHEEYKSCIDNAKDPYEYKRWLNLPKPHLSFFERRIDRHFYRGPVEEKNECYFFKKEDGDKKLTNFVIEVMHTMETPVGLERYCRFKSNYGDSAPKIMTPEIMSSKQAFTKFCYESGDYQFHGNDDQLKRIWDYIFMHQTGKTIQKLKTYGYNVEFGAWFFNNGAYAADAYYPADEEGVVWINDIGFKLHDMKEFDTPNLDPGVYEGITLQSILSRLSEITGENQAKVILAWTVGAFFMPEILHNYEIYPFFFIHGKTGQGKTTITNWISNFFGFEQKGFPFSASSTVGIQRVTSVMSMIPVWLEEYRNTDDKIGQKNTFLRGIYDRTTVLKGTIKEDEIKTYKARSTVILSGEEHPKDSALNSRCIMFQPDKHNGISQAYLWMETNKRYFNSIGHQLLTSKKMLWPKIKSAIDEYQKDFNEDMSSVSNRIKKINSIIAGISDVLLGQSSNFTMFIGAEAQKTEGKRVEEQALNVFFQDICDLYGTGQIHFKFLDKAFNQETGKDEWRLYYGGLYSIWEQKFKGLRNDLPIGKTSILNHLRTEKYFIDYRQIRMDGILKRCVILDNAFISMAQSLSALVSMVESNNKDQRDAFDYKAAPMYREDR